MNRYTIPTVLILLAGCGSSEIEEEAARAFTEGRAHQEKGDLAKAAAAYDRAIELDPGNAEAYVHRAEVRLISGNPDGALEDCEEAVRLGSRAAAYRVRASVQSSRGDFKAALADLDKAIELDPDDAATIRSRWAIYRGKGDRAKADADWAAAMKIENPDHRLGSVTAIAEGDFLTVLLGGKTASIRPYGVDCPESDQPFGAEVKEFVSKRALGRAVSVKVIHAEQDGHTVGRVIVAGDIDLSRLLLEHGMAWLSPDRVGDNEDLAALEATAREGKRGLWSAAKPPIAPWDWRAGERGEAETDQP